VGGLASLWFRSFRSSEGDKRTFVHLIPVCVPCVAEELSTYRTELMKFSAFIHHPSEALEDAAWTKTFTAVERAEWVDNGFESRGQQTLQLTLTRLTELTRALEQSLSDRDSTQKQCLQEEEERRQINRKVRREGTTHARRCASLQKPYSNVGKTYIAEG
jgi:hypothetical protein